MASIIKENESNKYSKIVSELINEKYLKETVKNNILLLMTIIIR